MSENVVLAGIRKHIKAKREEQTFAAGELDQARENLGRINEEIDELVRQEQWWHNRFCKEDYLSADPIYQTHAEKIESILEENGDVMKVSDIMKKMIDDGRMVNSSDNVRYNQIYKIMRNHDDRFISVSRGYWGLAKHQSRA